MIETRYKNKTTSKVKTFTKRLLIVSIVLIAVLVASCGAIPGATECNTVVDSFMQAGAVKNVNAAYDLCVDGKGGYRKLDIGLPPVLYWLSGYYHKIYRRRLR
jgi:hypothetical protein